MSENEIKTVLSNIMGDFLRTFEGEEHSLHADCIVAGGAIASLLLDEKIADVDIYLRSPKALDDYEVLAERQVHIAVDEAQAYDLVVRTESADTYTHTTNVDMPAIQIIKMMIGQPEDIVRKFDFLHTKVYYDLSSDVLSIPSDSMECIKEKVLFYTQTDYPLSSLFRSRKYIRRGWRMPVTEYIKIALDTNKLNLLDYGVLVAQLRGVDEVYTGRIMEAVGQRAISYSKNAGDRVSVDPDVLYSILTCELYLPGDMRDVDQL